LNNQTKCPRILINYNFPNGVTYEEGNFVFIRKLSLFSIGTRIIINYNFSNGVTCEEGDFVFIRKLSLFSIGTINLPIVENLKIQPIFEFELIQFISKSFPLYRINLILSIHKNVQII